MNNRNWVLITGGTSGIGESTVVLLVKHGYEVITTGRNEKQLAILDEYSDKIHPVYLDLINRRSITDAVEQINRILAGSPLDILINNAGYAQSGFLLDLRIEQVDRQLQTNLINCFYLTSMLVPSMLKASDPRIIFIGSIVGTMRTPWTGVYSISKAALAALTDILRLELQPLGIRVSRLDLGSVATQLQQHTIRSSEWIDQQQSYYAKIYDWLEETSYQSFYSLPAIPSTKVSEKILKLITTRNLKSHYTLPRTAGFLLFIYKLIPQPLKEYLARRHFQLNEAHINRP